VTSATLYLYCGHNLVNCGHNLLTWGHNLVNWGHNLLNCGHNLENCGHNLVTWGHNLLTLGLNLVNCGHNVVKPIKTAGKTWHISPAFPGIPQDLGVGAWLQLTGALSQQYYYNDNCFPSPVHVQLFVCPSVRPSVRPLAIPGPYLKLGN